VEGKRVEGRRVEGRLWRAGVWRAGGKKRQQDKQNSIIMKHQLFFFFFFLFEKAVFLISSAEATEIQKNGGFSWDLRKVDVCFFDLIEAVLDLMKRIMGWRSHPVTQRPIVPALPPPRKNRWRASGSDFSFSTFSQSKSFGLFLCRRPGIFLLNESAHAVFQGCRHL
jgi:hypothetical protein